MIRLYYATSIDGCIADASGGVGWLEGFSGSKYGFDQFYSNIDTVVTGRTTYQQSLGFEADPYYDKKLVVLSSRELDVPDRVAVLRGDIALVAQKIHALADGDVWVVGGANVMSQFLAAGLVDRIDQFIVPVVLGRGRTAFFGYTGAPFAFELGTDRRFHDGVVQVTYLRR